MENNKKNDFDESKDKIYMNLNIQYAPNLVSSLASGDFNLIKPVVDHGGNFQLTVTDIQIDTRLIPLFIAELKQYQDYETLYPYGMASKLNGYMDTYFQLNYWVQIGFSSYLSEKIYLRKRVLQTSKAKSQNGKKEYVHDNNNRELYIYSYQEFLDLVNDGIYRAMPTDYQARGNCGFIIRNGKLMFVIQNANLFEVMKRNRISRLEIQFSPSLFQYLGTGFPIQNRTTYWTFDITEFENFNNQYYALIQNELCLQSWNCCKAIVIYSRNFPVAEEIFPTLELSDDVAHYRASRYSMRHIYNTAELKKKIIYIHYIDYTKTRTLANGISEHNICVDNGIKIDLEKALPVNKFDINVGWLDCYGNLFPLELPYGGCCNIRLCFSRKYNREMYDYRNIYNLANTVYPYLNNDENVMFNYTPSMDMQVNTWTPSYSTIPIIPAENENIEYLPKSPEYQEGTIENIEPVIPLLPEDVINEDIGEIPPITPIAPITSTIPLDLNTEKIPEEEENMEIDDNNNQEQNEEVDHGLNEEEDFYNKQNGIMNKFKNFINSFI